MVREKELERLIEKYDKSFWESDEPEISDEEYHLLTKELRDINPSHPLLTKIHTPLIKSNNKIKHKYPMLSLDKVYSIEELIEWAEKVKRNNDEYFLIENKFDGWSVEIDNGGMSTRGDGFEGDDISDKMIYVKLIDGSPVSNIVYEHGELVMLKSDFEKCKTYIFRKNGDQYKTSRTILTGLLADDKVRDDVSRILTFLPFQYKQIKIKFSELESLDWDYLIQERKSADYPIDGLVLKLADEEYAKSLGSTSHHVRSAMALKFTNPTGTTVLRDIRWSIGKHKITPVGIVDPVEIGGVIVDSPNLHNYKYIIDNDIHIGDTLIVERCGDIIPDVQKVIPGNDRLPIYLEQCPACYHDVEFRDPEIVCTNAECPGKHLKRLMDSVIRIGIERLGEPTLEKLISMGVTNLIDIFNLTKEDIILLDGFAETSSENLFNEIQKVKREGVFEWQILSSLNIKGVGDRMSKMILENMSLEELRATSTTYLKDIKGVGFITAHSIYCGLLDNREYIDSLLEILPIKGKENKVKTICFTGKMPETRSYYEELASNNGYEPVSKVTKDLSLLVCMDTNSNSGKTKKAKQYGIKIMSLEEWIKDYV